MLSRHAVASLHSHLLALRVVLERVVQGCCHHLLLLRVLLLRLRRRHVRRVHGVAVVDAQSVHSNGGRVVSSSARTRPAQTSALEHGR